MKRSMFRLLTSALAIIAIAFFTGSVFAQGDYRIEYANLPPDFNVLEIREVTDGSNSSIYIVGNLRVSGIRHGFVYDHSTGLLTDINTLLGLDPGLETRCYGINATGIVVGRINDLAGARAMWFDFLATTPTLNILDDEFVQLANYPTVARKVNNFGDILISIYPSDGGFVVNPQAIGGTSHLTSLPAEMVDPLAINDSGLVVGHNIWNGSDGGTTRYDLGTGATEVFPDFHSPNDINLFGEFCGFTKVFQGRRNFKRYAVRFGNQMDWLSDPIVVSEWGAQALNDEGDVTFRTYDSSTNADLGWLYHDGIGQSFELRSLVDDVFFNDATVIHPIYLSNRDQSLTSPAPVIGGQVTGASGERRTFLLFPEDPGSTPGISLFPTSGLTTTESDGQDSFDIVLDAQPVADVTIGISSSDVTEGAVNTTNMTFTPANWDTPQTVAITGVDDADLDGDVAYTIITAAATSTDPNYDGLNADDVSVTNLDDEAPPGGGSETYDNLDTPVAIPDNDPGGVASDIVAGDHTISNLTINVDITHQRPSDLEIYLVGPDGGPPVQLFNFSGDNNVADFNGTSSLGLWTLEVYDTRKKKTGTLISWSITVDY